MRTICGYPSRIRQDESSKQLNEAYFLLQSAHAGVNNGRRAAGEGDGPRGVPDLAQRLCRWQERDPIASKGDLRSRGGLAYRRKSHREQPPKLVRGPVEFGPNQRTEIEPVQKSKLLMIHRTFLFPILIHVACCVVSRSKT